MLPTPSISAHTTGQRSVFEGKTIMLSPDLGMESIEAVLKHGGAEVTSKIDTADMLICRYREGFAYRTASRLNINVGNLAWLYRLENTHLITAYGTSEKCNAAKKRGLEVVNHLWLEDSYAKWKLQPASDARYSHFPLRTNLGEVAG
ncbi:hypothetical protein N7499_003080 [Penicillium canescens]|uniref:uncharacterized protein n=1 Tax=Penicillium canescens TaxID=5083 RepID=UPI0026DFBD18|nr:uncharacterized protein N7446_011953 [Penicillium canescens]KAJ6019817.1 hypothetical protein N7522_000525 [Penicillium canescens]KAJ6047119.1 hypothetical protein N7446_011953 [Penicillium canescens]KAJ6093749.1 hypothetical protein N7499_003080 [Penicillium canescens]